MLKQFRINLTERDKDPVVTFSKLKYFYDYSDICYIVDNLNPNNRTHEKLIYGCSTPKSISELGDTETLHTDKNDDLIKEINWALLSVRKFENEINSFVKLREQYENALLIGEYEESLKYIDAIERDICISLWSIEQRFILIEIQKGLKENTAFLTKINKDNKKWFIKYFSHFFSLKSEKEVSINQYKMSLARLLFKSYEDQNHMDLEYYNFKLNFLEVDSFQYLPAFLTFEGYHSIIDKYISLIRILQLEILKPKKEKKYSHALDSRLYYLSKKIKDSQIDKLQFALDTKFDWDYKISNIDKTTIIALDLYTSGNFVEAECKLLDIILECPKNIELYEVYIKTLILQNKKFNPIGKIKDSFQNRILMNLFKLFEKKDGNLESLNELQRIAYNLSSINSVSYTLINYYHYEEEGVKKMVPLAMLNSNFFNPKLLFQYCSNKTFKVVENKLGPSLTFDLLSLQNNVDLNRIKSHQSLSSQRKLILEANYYQETKSYAKAVKIWEKILLQKDLRDFQKESILINLFVCKEHLHLYDECIDLYVNQYFENAVLVKNIKVEEIKKEIKKRKYKIVKHTINLPIFYKLTDSEDYEIHTAYECFLQKNKFFTPKDLTLKVPQIEYVRLVFFLENICTLDIFKHSPFITSSKHKIDERISVCKFLLDINQSKADDYLNEIERLTKKQIIQKGIQEIDESKIYVNQNGIIETELKNIQPIYNRFKAIGELSSETNISIISLYSDKVLSFKNSKKNDGNEFSKDPQFDVFKDIFHYVLNKFLFSNYGLQQYLSARIRHGVLLGEIRPEFELLNLITEIEKGIDKYKPNDFWNVVLQFENETQYNKVQSIFGDFSRKIDTLINEEILSKFLQIKLENNNPEGWLDYTFEDFLLQIHYIPLKDSKNIDVFLNSIFDILWQRTEKNLEIVRENINEKIRDDFFKIILELENNLLTELDSIPEVLYNNITESRVNIENKLNKIASWFNITDSNISDFKMSKIIDVSLEYSQQSNINKAIDLELNLNDTDLIKGIFYPAFVDLFRIFLENSLKHSGFEEGERIPISISVFHSNGFLQIDIINSLSELIDINEIRSKIDSFVMDLNQSMIEGRSGFHKAMRIIKSDFNNDSNDMRMSIDEKNQFCVSISISSKNLLV